jgi:hypothetical protein
LKTVGAHVDGLSLDEEMRESLLQLLGLAEQWQDEGRLEEAEQAYREVILTAEQQHLPDLAERGQRGLSALLTWQRLAQAEAALTGHNLADAEASYREVYEKLAPGDAAAAAGLAQANFLLGQQAEADERPMVACDYYAEAFRLDPNLLQARARLAALSSSERELPRLKILWLLIPTALVLIAIAVLFLRPRSATVATAPTVLPPSPTAPAIAQGVAPPVYSPTAYPSPTPAEITPPTVAPAPSTVPSHTPSVTPPLPLGIDLTFVGRVQQPDGGPLAGFQYVQLWGSNDPDRGLDPIQSVLSGPDGSFTLQTTEVYDYYFVTLDTEFPETFEYITATPGSGGIRRGPREIRYQHPANGTQDAIIFIVRTLPPAATPTPTPMPTSTATPRLPAITLQEPFPDFSVRDSVQFRWESDRPLPDDMSYEVVMWTDGQNSRDALGVVNVTRDRQTSVDFQAVSQIHSGTYYWTVLLVRTAPAYQRLSQPTVGRRIYIEK